MENKETLEEAYKSGKTIQCKASGQWKDFIPQNQLDKPNWEYTGINNWRIKPEESNIISNWLSENRNPEIDKQVNEEAKELQKQHLINIMKGDEELELYKETLEEANWKVLDTKTDTFIRGAEWMQERSYSWKELRLWLIHRDVYLYNYYTTYINSKIPLQSVDDFIKDNHEYLMDRKLFKRK